MSEELIIRHGAPTLAGLKTGSVFQCPYQDAGMLLRELRQLMYSFPLKGCGFCRCGFLKIGRCCICTVPVG